MTIDEAQRINSIGLTMKIIVDQFYDNGIRNMIIGSMNEVAMRPDLGALWENFLISERIKQNRYKFL